jgi:tetratricopeptide (TPR) repeat protein
MTRVLIAVGFLWLAGCGRSLDPATEAAFLQAQQGFDSAKSPTDFLLAASLFQKIRDQGLESGAVYYNQGNAYMRGGQRGRAIACYRQAKRYLPRDPRLDANLQFALGGTTRQTGRPLLEYVFFWQDWLSYSGKFQLSALFAALTLVLGLTALLAPQRIWRQGALFGLAVTFIFSCSALYDWYRFDHLQHGVVTTREATAHKGNADSYEPALTAPLPEGTEFTVVERRGDWVLGRLPAGQEGWLKASEVVTY